MGFVAYAFRYVSLDLLGYMADEIGSKDFEHLDIVLDCLLENDLSVKRLALKVLKSLANGDNVKGKFYIF